MRIARLTSGLILTLLCISLQAQTPEQKLTVTGKLSRAMAIGGETTGWVIQLESEMTIDGKQVDSIELDYHKTSKLEKLQNQRVQVVGTLSHRQGVETGERTSSCRFLNQRSQGHRATEIRAGGPLQPHRQRVATRRSRWQRSDGQYSSDTHLPRSREDRRERIVQSLLWSRRDRRGHDQIGSSGFNPDGLSRGGDEPGDEISGCAPGSRALRVERSLFADLLQGLRKAAPLHAPVTQSRPSTLNKVTRPTPIVQTGTHKTRGLCRRERPRSCSFPTSIRMWNPMFWVEQRFNAALRASVRDGCSQLRYVN